MFECGVDFKSRLNRWRYSNLIFYCPSGFMFISSYLSPFRLLQVEIVAQLRILDVRL